ncbi:MAG: acyl-CoA dehydrogenase family protein [Actinocatenispora sp.]
MDFRLSDEQRLLSDTARRMATETLFPQLHELPETPVPHERLVRLFGLVEPLGVLGARVPEEMGGSGLSCLEYGLVMEQLPPVLAVAVQAHEGTASRIALGGDDDQRREFLPRLLNGTAIAATATSEPEVGSDPRAVAALAESTGTGFRLSGRKLWVTNGTVADLLMVVARLRRADGTVETGRLLLDRAVSPFETREVEAIGLRQGHLAEVTLDAVPVPARNEIRDAGRFHQQMTRTWLANRAMLGLIGAGIARRALDASVRYARERKQFGAVIGSYQLVQELIVQIAMAADIGQLLAYRALSMIDDGGWPHAETSMAKLYGTDAAVRACSLAIEVHGSYGLTVEYGLERMLRDARMLGFPDGTRQVQQLIIGRELLGIRAFRH